MSEGRDGLAMIVVGEILRVQSAELEELISIRGDIDVHETFEIVFFLLLTVPRPRKPSTSPRFFVHVPHELWRPSANPRPASAH